MIYLVQASGGLRVFWDGENWNGFEKARRYATLADLPNEIYHHPRNDRPGKLPKYGDCALVTAIPDINKLIF